MSCYSQSSVTGLCDCRHLDDVQQAHQPQAAQRSQHDEANVAGVVAGRHRHQYQLYANMKRGSAMSCNCQQ